MSGCHDNCGLCSMCSLSGMDAACDRIAAERDALRDQLAAATRERDDVAFAGVNALAHAGKYLARAESAEARLARVEAAAREVANFFTSTRNASEWFDDEAERCYRRTGLYPNGKDIMHGGDRDKREAAWNEHLRLRKLEMFAALDAVLGERAEGGETNG